MLHTFVSYVEDKPGVLTRVTSLFRRLNINIISLTVGRSEKPGLSRLTLVCWPMMMIPILIRSRRFLPLARLTACLR